MASPGFAPAKVNLCLHVTGRRDDGYHLIDSLVVFAAIGDEVSLDPTRRGLRVTGPCAVGVPTDATNLVVRAAALLGAEDIGLTLEKRLPTSAGIGGGSSDAAATLRLVSQSTRRPLPDDVSCLGADVPVCLAARPARMRGIGEILEYLPPLPGAWLVLANPGVSVSTASVFRSLETVNNPPLPETVPQWQDVVEMAEWLTAQRNDLELAARKLAPEIDTVLAALAVTDGCLLARMSGSGATCFGLYRDEPEARTAAGALSRQQGNWWIAAAPLLR